jgi:hypothetical protein
MNSCNSEEEGRGRELAQVHHDLGLPTSPSSCSPRLQALIHRAHPKHRCTSSLLSPDKPRPVISSSCAAQSSSAARTVQRDNRDHKPAASTSGVGAVVTRIGILVRNVPGTAGETGWHWGQQRLNSCNVFALEFERCFDLFAGLTSGQRMESS